MLRLVAGGLLDLLLQHSRGRGQPSPESRRRAPASMAIPVHSMSTSTGTSGISIVSSSGASAVCVPAPARRCCVEASTAALSAPQYAAARSTGTSANGICAFPLPVRSVYSVIGWPRSSSASTSMPCERRDGSSTNLASIESYASPRSSTPARRSTCQSYLMLCPALGTAASSQQLADRRAGRSSSSGGRFRTGAASAPSASSVAGGPVAEREVPDLGGDDGERKSDQFGAVRLERRGLGVERHQGACRSRATPARSARSGSHRPTVTASDRAAARTGAPP